MADNRPIASTWYPNVEAPDMSNILKMAGRTGRNEGYNQFMKELNEFKAEQIKAREEKREERAEAVKDLGNEPESPGFWSKMGQMAGEGLERTLDVMSRLNYTTANMADYVFDQNEDKSNFLDTISPLGANPLNSLDDFNIGDIGGVLKAGWQGFSGKEKTTFGQVIAEQAKKDPAKSLQDNKIYQGVMGFAADVALDPTTYIGVGLVTKPLKSGISSVSDDLVDEVGKLNITRPNQEGVEVPLSPVEIRTLLGYRPSNTVPKGMNKKQARQWRNRRAVSGKSRRSKSTEAAQVRERVEGLAKIREAIRNDPKITDNGVKLIDESIARYQQTLDNMVNDYGRNAYGAAMKKFDSRPGLGGAPSKGARVVEEELTELTDLARLKKGTRSWGYHKRKKGDTKRNEATMAWAVKNIMDDPNVSDEFKSNIWGNLDSAVKNNDEWIKKQAEIKAVAQRRDNIKKGQDEGEHWSQQAGASAVGSAQKKLSVLHEERAAIEARILRDLIAGDINKTNMLKIDMYGDEYGELVTRKAELLKLLKDRFPATLDEDTYKVVGSGRADVRAGDDNDIPWDGDLSNAERNLQDIAAGRSGDQRSAIIQELKEIDADLKSMNEDYLARNPGKAQFDSRYAKTPRVRKEDVDAETWSSLQKENYNRTAERLYDQKLKTAARKERVGGKNAKLHKMYGGKDDGKFRVEVDGKKYTDSELKAQIKSGKIQSTKADWEKAKKSIEPDGTYTPVEKITFDRLFKDQHGMSVFDAAQLRQIDEGRFIDYRGERFTQAKFIDEVFKNPDHFSATNRTGFTLPREVYPDEVAARVGDKRFGFRKFAAAMEREFKDAGSTLSKKELDEKIQAEWQDVFKAFVSNPDLREEATESIRNSWNWKHNLDKNEKVGLKTGENISNKKVPEDEKKKLWAEAKAEARDKIENATVLDDVSEAAEGITTTRTRKVFENETNDPTISPEELNAEALRKAREEYANDVAKVKMQRFVEGDEGYRAKAEILDRLKVVRDRRIKQANEALDEAKKARAAMSDRLDEQLTLNMLAENVSNGKTYARVSFAGIKVADLTGPDWMVKTTSAVSRLPILQAANRVWSNAFHPASKLEPEINLARLRAQARTPDIIKHHLDSLRNTFSKYKPDERIDAVNLMKRGTPPVGKLQEDTKAFFDDYAKHTSGKTFIGQGDEAEALKISDLNHYLPDEFKFIHPSPKGNVNSMRLHSAEDILKAMRNLRGNTDPMKAMWHMQIAAEQAMAYKAMQHTVKKSFGVKREMPKFGDSKELSERASIIEDLQREHGWGTHKDIGQDYYFAPEMLDQIDKLLEIMQPAKVHELMRTYDKVQRIWKSTVTVYNPGYYARNGIGETIMGMMDGLTNPKWYSKARQVIKYAMPDDVEEALKSLEPWARHATKSQKGVRKVVRLKGGKELSVEDVWVLYSEVGLKSGFISSEYEHFFPAANTARATPVGQFATKINDSVRQGGEKYEDFFRLSHFMYRMERSGHRDPLAAAEEAANHVRKYHFDYTDFTPTEKAVFMRIFPFYKWTRKSLPLMTGMLFTKPGAALAYPKAMTGISYATGGTDPLQDDNGFMPNYEDITPEWMQGLFAYPIGRDEADAMTYMNVATPQMDIYKMMQDPVSATIGMMSPLYKYPLEQGMGRTLDPDFDMELKEQEDRINHTMRLTPASSLLNNMYDNSGAGDSAISEPGASVTDERLTSFLTGLGFYENNEQRQKGEEFRRNMEKGGF